MSFDDDFLADSGEELFWYTLQVFNNEERSVSLIKEHISHNKLQDRIVDIKILKEFSIVESEEYPSDSDYLPKRGFKSTDKSVWVKISNGSYKKVSIIEKKPFSGMVFIKMEHSPELFKKISSWGVGFHFLGSPKPHSMSDLQLQRTEESLNKERPDIMKYIQEKNYLLVEGSLSMFKTAVVEESHDDEEDKVEEKAHHKPKDKLETIVKSDEDKKAEIYSDLKIKEYENAFPVHKPSGKKKTGKKFNVNDFVFIKHLGFKGVIQDINYEEDKVIVGVQMFGRKQPVECKLSEISSI